QANVRFGIVAFIGIDAEFIEGYGSAVVDGFRHDGRVLPGGMGIPDVNVITSVDLHAPRGDDTGILMIRNPAAQDLIDGLVRVENIGVMESMPAPPAYCLDENLPKFAHETL